MVFVREFLPGVLSLSVSRVVIGLKPFSGREVNVRQNRVQSGPGLASWDGLFGRRVLRIFRVSKPHPGKVELRLEPGKQHRLKRGDVPNRLLVRNHAVICQDGRCKWIGKVESVNNSLGLLGIAKQDLGRPRIWPSPVCPETVT